MADKDHLRWLGQEFSVQLGKALEGMAGQNFPVTFEMADPSEAKQSPLMWWETPLSAPSGARISIGASEGVWRVIGKALLEAIGLDTDEASLRSTYTETLTQALSALASAIGGRLGTEVTCGAGVERDRALDQGIAMRVSIELAEASSSVLAVVFSPELTSALGPKAAAPVAPAPSSGGTMDLLLDVELPVSVSFGRTELPLKDVVKLTTGSIVELNRSISEPVEIIVNNCVIARGEVVVIEGNYGVRIDQIISRQERLRTLR